MLAPLFDIALLEGALENTTLDSSALVITANNRLANHIRQSWGLKQVRNGVSGWRPPSVFALDSWIDNQWQELCDLGLEGTELIILNEQQELVLWNSVIADDRHCPPELPIAATARQAQKAYRLLRQWEIPEQLLSDESPHLSRWITAIKRQLQKLSATTRSDSVSILADAYLDRHLPNYQEIVLVGFQTLPPLHQRLLECAGSRLVDAASTTISSTGCTVCLENEVEEIQAAAIWARERLAQSPEQRIGIVIPSLSRLRPQVERLFREQLQPDYWSLDAYAGATPFNISAGIALADTAIVNSALLLLSLNRKSLPLADCCRILNSPFWGGTSETGLRAAAEIQLRQRASHEIPCGDFRFQLHRLEVMGEIAAEDSLVKKLEIFETLKRNAAPRQSAANWCALFSRQLSALGWPGKRGLNSVEYQQRQHWQALLEEQGKIDQIKPAISCEEALQYLAEAAAKMPFQAETPDHPIQILGALEAVGLRFDHLWLSGMTDQVWPQPTQFNPLLPVHLQRQYQTPLSLPERELKIAQQVIRQFQCNAENIVFSHCRYEGDSQVCGSPLIEDIPTTTIDCLINPASLQQRCYSDRPAVTLERVECSHGPGVDTSLPSVKGGSAIFDAQAACPFNAFAKYRLNAEQPPEPTLGLTAAERGSLLHRVMELVWRSLGSLQGLQSRSDEDLDSLLENSVEEAMQPLYQQRKELMSPAFAALEKRRLRRLIRQWLELEAQRPDFRVSELEQSCETRFADLPLKLKIDRIDVTPDGDKIIIDYKTGKAAVKNWFGERPTQPQLPLYALSGNSSTSVITFANINLEQPGFSGVGRDKSLLPGLVGADSYEGFESWEQLQQHWHEKLTALAEEFKSGCADVTIYNPKAIQWQAELLPLNRWYGYLEENQ